MPIQPFKPIIKCECMDSKTIEDLRTALLTARDTYRDVSISLDATNPILSQAIDVLESSAYRFDILVGEFGKMKICPPNQIMKDMKKSA